MWSWRRRPDLRWLIAGGLALIAFTWFGIPTITNGRPLVAGQLAMNSPRELHHNQVFGTMGRFTELQYLPMQLLALLTVVVAILRRNLTLMILAAGTVGWVLVEVAFALHGWPGLQRYMFEPAGVMIVLGGVGVGWIASHVPRLHVRVPAWAGAVAVALVALTLVPGALSRLRVEHKDLLLERHRTVLIGQMENTMTAVGGPQRILRCGHPVTIVEFLSVMARYTHLNVGLVGFRELPEYRRPSPKIFVMPVPVGWTVLPHHLRRRTLSTCATLQRTFLYRPATVRPIPTGFIRPNLH